MEIFFGIITRQAIRRGTYRSVKDLTADIGAFIDGWNELCEPFTWTKTADDLLPQCKPGKELRSRDTRVRWARPGLRRQRIPGVPRLMTNLPIPQLPMYRMVSMNW
jgi:hypothetical protein